MDEYPVPFLSFRMLQVACARTSGEDRRTFSACTKTGMSPLKPAIDSRHTAICSCNNTFCVLTCYWQRLALFRDDVLMNTSRASNIFLDENRLGGVKMASYRLLFRHSQPLTLNGN